MGISSLASFSYSAGLNHKFLLDDWRGVNHLLERLSPDVAPLAGIHELDLVAGSGRIFFARAGEERMGHHVRVLAGMTFLSELHTLFDDIGWIDDVVVHENYLKLGIGSHLVEHAIAYAREKKLRHVDLTSNAKRGPANEMYPKLGFSRIEKSICAPYHLAPGENISERIMELEDRTGGVTVSNSHMQNDEIAPLREVMAAEFPQEAALFTIDRAESVSRRGAIFLARAKYASHSAAPRILGVGYVVLKRTPSGITGFVADVMAHPEYAGKEIERLILARCAEWARGKGCGKVMLRAEPGWYKAHAEYLGFTAANTNYYTLPLVAEISV